MHEGGAEFVPGCRSPECECQIILFGPFDHSENQRDAESVSASSGSALRTSQGVFDEFAAPAQAAGY